MLKAAKDIAIILSFPDNWAKYHSKVSDWLIKMRIAKQQYYHVGHAAVLLIKATTGKIEYFDFGRYTTGGEHGRVRSADTDPILTLDIKAQFNFNGTISNLHDIIRTLDNNKHYTHGHGKVLFSTCQIDFDKAKTYIQTQIKQICIPYSPFTKNASNCSRFVRDVVIASCTDHIVYNQLRYPATFTPTPTGNVLNATLENLIHQYENDEFSTSVLSRTTERKQIVADLFKSSTLTEHNTNVNTKDYLRPPSRHKHVPISAHWLGGIGEGAWINITQAKTALHHFKITRWDKDGKKEYKINSYLSKLGFNLTYPYTIDYNSNRLKTTVVQNSIYYIFMINNQMVERNTIYEKDNFLL